MTPARIESTINDTYSSQLKIKHGSRGINKLSNSSSMNIAADNHPQQNRQRREPIVIYTHSPKVIHTTASNFMALVQKLTGFSHNDDGDDPKKKDHNNVNDHGNVYGRIGHQLWEDQGHGCDDDNDVISDGSSGINPYGTNVMVNSASIFSPPGILNGDIPLYMPIDDDPFSQLRIYQHNGVFPPNRCN